MNELNARYWNDKYEHGYTGWDIGHPSPPLQEFIDQLKDTEQHILVPGAGNGYEVEYLWKCGFKHITVVDLAKIPLERIDKRLPSGHTVKLIEGDFFDHNGEYDLILEQTFFCALDPYKRKDYSRKMKDLLKDNGILAGVLFNIEFDRPGPPFGGNAKEYRALFKPHFSIRRLDKCYNSISPRMDTEIFIYLEKK